MAFLTRLVPVLRGGGLGYYGRYDDGVYFAAADALTFGAVPYRDFVLLHPPGGVLVLAPFALIARLTSDPTGLALARLAFMGLGALSAVLAAAVASRWGRRAAIVAGLLYACAPAAIYSEQATFLEPIGSLLVLIALLALTRRGGAHGARLEILAGAALGLACTVKIWYAAPFVTVLVVLLAERSGRAAARVIAAGGVGAAVVLLPFFALAPQRMWTMVVGDQLDRAERAMSAAERLQRMVGLDRVVPDSAAALIAAATAVIVVVAAVSVMVGLLDQRTRVVAAVTLANGGVLLASPVYFRHYGVFVVGPAAVMLGAFVGPRLGRISKRRARAALGAVLAVTVLAVGVGAARIPAGDRFPTARLRAAAPAGCIAADDPAALIQLDRLSSDLRDHCQVPVDVTGASYGTSVSRRENTAFHAWLMTYLTHSAAFIDLRPKRDSFTDEEKAALRSYPTLATAAGLHLRRGNRGVEVSGRGPADGSAGQRGPSDPSG